MKEVRIVSGSLSAGTWSGFEQLLARHVNEGWVVIGFSAGPDVPHGDIAYALLQREVPALVQPPKTPTSQERLGS